MNKELGKSFEPDCDFVTSTSTNKDGPAYWLDENGIRELTPEELEEFSMSGVVKPETQDKIECHGSVSECPYCDEHECCSQHVLVPMSDGVVDAVQRTQSVDEVVEEFNNKFTYAGNGYHLDDTVDVSTAFDWLRTTLTARDRAHSESTLHGYAEHYQEGFNEGKAEASLKGERRRIIMQLREEVRAEERAKVMEEIQKLEFRSEFESETLRGAAYVGWTRAIVDVLKIIKDL